MMKKMDGPLGMAECDEKKTSPDYVIGSQTYMT
jgi:hypothetical protein